MLESSELLERYDNPVIRSLVQLVPFGVGAGADVAVMHTISKMRRKRLREFFDELSRGNVLVDQKLLESEDFLHCYFCTAKHVLETRRTEKIEMFARLLTNAAHDDGEVDYDVYEEYAAILDDLGYREWRALVILSNEAAKHPRNKNQNELQWVGSAWGDFCKRLNDELGVPENEVSSFMGRIGRTGCYKEYTGTAVGSGGGRGTLTPLFGRLHAWVTDGGSVV